MSSRLGLPRAIGLAVLLAAPSLQAQLPTTPPVTDAAPSLSEPVPAPSELTPAEAGVSEPAPVPAVSEPEPVPVPVASPPSRPDSAPPRESAAATTPPAEAAPSGRRLRWTYPRFRWWEYVLAGAVTVGNIGMEIAYQAEPKQDWHAPVLFDGPVRGWLKADSKEWESHATYIGDYTWYTIQWYVLLDGIVTPLATDRFNTDVAFQLTLLNWQAIGLTGLLSRLSHVTSGRTRPSLQGCSDEPDAENRCEFRGASFFSGHAAMTTASAALGCMNHRYLPLYGGGLADKVVCPVLLTGAATVGVMRIVNDKHWVSDVVAGWALGGLIGFGLPYALHYGPSAVRTALQPTPHTALVPWADSSSGGLQWMGAL